MFYVDDEVMGRIDICELQPGDLEYIVQLLTNESQSTDNPNIRDRAIRLASEMGMDDDYEMAWADVFLIAQLLMTVAYDADVINMVAKRRADRLLDAFEAATKRICKSAE